MIKYCETWRSNSSLDFNEISNLILFPSFSSSFQPKIKKKMKIDRKIFILKVKSFDAIVNDFYNKKNSLPMFDKKLKRK